MSEQEWPHECGPGWRALVDPLIERCTQLGGEVTQVKEKFGRLRFYYHLPEVGSLAQEVAQTAFGDEVDAAEHESAYVCEMCGRLGRLMKKGGWLKTLCREDSLQLGYKESAS